MGAMNHKETVQSQYQDASNLNTRISIHDKYSENKQGFGNWVVSNYDIKQGARVLELGCGSGSVWVGHEAVIAKCAELVMTDFSEGMLATARKNVGERANVTYRQVDIQDIPFEKDSFDVIIANMMLYHVPDLQKGLSEVARVLKPGGKFYCATSGEHGIVERVADMLRPYGMEYRYELSFSLQNGRTQLATYFSQVEMLEYIDALAVTDAQDLVDYVFSGITMAKTCNLSREEVKAIFEKKMVNGVLRLPKEVGMFVCEL